MAQTVPAHLLVGGYRIDHKVLASIQDASRKTGVSFAFLMAQAGRESAFHPDAGNTRSSASGLYQFTNGTWLELMKKHGAEHGYGDMSRAIKVSGDGDYEVADPALNRRILELRRNPGLASVMAGEYANDNRSILEDKLGRKTTPADLYLAHFLGPQGAVHFLRAMETNPHRPAAEFVPTAAHVNPRVFYNHGRAADLATVYGRIRGIVDNARHYTHLEGVPAWEAMFTENVSLKSQYARPPKEPEPWMREWTDSIEQESRPARVETWVADAADSMEPVAQASPAPPASPAFAARRLAEVATLVPQANAAELQPGPDPEATAKKDTVSFHTLWMSLFGRGEV
jgi:hypothetical protein